MDSERLGSARLWNLLLWPAGRMMGSRLRARLSDPTKKLRAAHLQPGQTVLEVGCGTGFFTVPAARLIGDDGRLLAMDVMAGYLDQVAEKVRRAGLHNVQLVKRDALHTGLDAASVDVVLLFGVLPFPSLPLDRLLPEMHRVLAPQGNLAVWLFPVRGWVPRSIGGSGLFSFEDEQSGVYNFGPCTEPRA